MERDFTLTKYRKLCEVLLASGYTPTTVRDYLRGSTDNNIVILRHDVDVSAKKALRMAEAENTLGVRSTYYFRMIPKVFEPDVIRRISRMGHEVGYHYEVLDKTNGNVEKAIKLFDDELTEFRKVCDVKTMVMHGNPLTSWDNRTLWEKKSFKDYGILGETYLSIDYSKIYYFTDTGRSWNSRFSLKDSTRIKNPYMKQMSCTDDLINQIKTKELDNLCINTHPKRWNDPLLPWVKELCLQSAKNCIKLGLKWKNK